MVMDHCGGDEEKNLPSNTPDFSMSDSKRGRSPARPIFIDVHSSKPSTSISQPPPPDSASLTTSPHNAAAVYQPAVKEEESRSEKS